MSRVSIAYKVLCLPLLAASALVLREWVLKDVPLGQYGPILGFALVVSAVWWIGMALHELAHLLAARAYGVAIAELGIGRLLISWEGSRPRFRRHRPTTGFRGLTRLANRFRFPDGADRPYVRAVAAGPAAGILWGVATLSFSKNVGLGPDWLQLGLIAGSMAHLARTGLDLLPFPRDGISTDGSRLLANLRKQPATDPGMTFGELLETISGAVSPGSWPEELVDAQEAILASQAQRSGDDRELALVAGYLLYLHYADRHEWVEANHVITAAVEIPRGNRHFGRNDLDDMVDVVYAIHLALRGMNALGARSSLNRMRRRSPWRQSSLVAGARAAIALAAGDPETAALDAAKARTVLARSNEPLGIARLLDSWWDDVLTYSRRPLRPLPVSASDPPMLGSVIVPFPVLPAEPALPLDLFAWDPGVASEYRTLWIWRRRAVTDLDISA